MTTNNVTDLRIDGDGFFAVSPFGDETVYLTRSGNFNIDATRNLVNIDGLHVLDTDGAPIVLDEGVVAFSISQSGEIIAINEEGTAEPTGTFITVVKVANPAGLEKIGGNLYRSTPNATIEDFELSQANNLALGTGAIISGQLEMSNVELTNELTEMIIAQRGFQANSRIITTSDEVLQEILNLKR
jgi:flagellar hook protein FlgE